MGLFGSGLLPRLGVQHISGTALHQLLAGVGVLAFTEVLELAEGEAQRQINAHRLDASPMHLAGVEDHVVFAETTDALAGSPALVGVVTDEAFFHQVSGQSPGAAPAHLG